MHYKTWTLPGLFCCLLFVGQSAQAWADTLYVKPVASGQKNGQSWANALGGPLAALILAKKGDHIWMAAGDYNVIDTIAFELKSGVALYGGFAGTETSLAQRDWQKNRTNLFSEPVEGVPSKGIYCGGTDTGTLIDGITIKECIFFPSRYGLSCELDTFSWIHYYCHGGGLYVYSTGPHQPTHLTVRNCTFERNYATYGGGIAIRFINYGYGSVKVINCTFQENAGDMGGGMYVLLSSDRPTEILVDSCRFLGNTSGPFNGGGINLTNNNRAAKIRIRNTLFEGNVGSRLFGGAVYVDNYPANLTSPYELEISACRFVRNKLGSPSFPHGWGGAVAGAFFDVRDCVFIGNETAYGGALSVAGVRVYNSLFYGNYGGYRGGAGVLGGLNMFVNCSFINNSSTVGGAFDLDNESRFPDTFANCLFWNNRAGTLGNLAVGDGREANFYAEHCRVDEGACEDLQNDLLATCGPNLIWGDDPMLWDTTVGDFHPQMGSPLRGAGNPAWTKRFGIPRDLGGAPRPLGQAPSIGAYEATGQLPVLDASGEAPFLEVFPNPALGMAFARFKGVGTGPFTLRAFDSLGRLLWKGNAGVSLTELPCADWPTGTYTLILENNKGRRVACRWVKG